MWKVHKTYSSKFKLKVVLEMIGNMRTQAQIASEYGVNPTQQSKRKKQFLENAELVFTDKRRKENQDAEKTIENLYKKIGQLSYENDWLEKKSGIEFGISN